jgi:hypothetical protein
MQKLAKIDLQRPPLTYKSQKNIFVAKANNNNKKQLIFPINMLK